MDLLFLVERTGDFPDFQCDHPFFKKNYKPERTQKKEVLNEMLSNDDGFFDGLPISKSKVKRTKLNILQQKGDSEEANIERVQ